MEDKSPQVIPLNTLKRVTFDAKTGAMGLIASPVPKGVEDIVLEFDLQFSPEVTKEIALTLARIHKFSEEELLGQPVTYVRQ